MSRFFDGNGQCKSTLVARHYRSSEQDTFEFGRLTIDYEARHKRFTEVLPGRMILPSLAQFAGESEKIMHLLRSNLELAPLLNGLCLPLIFPQLIMADYGCYFDAIFVGAVSRACKAQFRKLEFQHQQHGYLGLDIKVNSESRHEELVTLMAYRPVVALFFPMALLRFSVHGCRMAISQLPRQILLAGGVDTALALTGYPDILAPPDSLKPYFRMPGIELGPDTRTPSFMWFDDCLSFSEDRTDNTDTDVTSGLLVLSQE